IRLLRAPSPRWESRATRKIPTIDGMMTPLRRATHPRIATTDSRKAQCAAVKLITCIGSITPYFSFCKISEVFCIQYVPLRGNLTLPSGRSALLACSVDVDGARHECQRCRAFAVVNLRSDAHRHSTGRTIDTPDREDGILFGR